MEYDFLFKIVTIGDSSVGKSSILTRYVDNVFSENYISTIGVDFKIKTINIKDKNIKLQIWDTAGQERFKTITQSYYRGASAILLIYDLTDISTFQNLNKWLMDVKKANNDAQIFIIGNKLDLFDCRQIKYNEAKNFTEKHGYKYIEVSAKTNKGINNLFIDLCESLIKNHTINYCLNHDESIINIPQSVPISKCQCIY